MPDSLNLDDIVLGPDDEPPNRAKRKDKRGGRPGRKRVAEPLQELSEPFVRVPIPWLTDPCRQRAFPPEVRLLLYLLFRSRWGRHGVGVTNEFIAEVGISERTTQRALVRLERKGLIRVERHPRQDAPIVGRSWRLNEPLSPHLSPRATASVATWRHLCDQSDAGAVQFGRSQRCGTFLCTSLRRL
jgi:hypothetical protein